MKSAAEKSGSIKEPVIVVSDVHLGDEASNFREFWNFLDWLTTLPAEGKALKCNATELTIKRPGTIVLLGDILELWDPRGDDRNYVAKDVLTPISILNDLDCDIIYVIGNHDEDIFEIKKVWKTKGVEFPYKGNGTFKIFYRTYPKRVKGTKRVEGVDIGQKKYVFLHGQQFDKFQIFYTISRFLKVRFDPIDWFQDLANVSFTKNIGLGLKKKDTPKGVRGKIKTHMATVIFSVLLIMYLSLYYLLKAIPIGSGLGILWMIISAFFVVTILPKVVTWLNTAIWRRNTGKIIPKCMPVKDVIEDRYVDEKGKHIDADVVVFGHTHYAGTYYMEAKKRLFINTGAWVEISEECEKQGAAPNTFLYIDAEAPHLLQWNKEQVGNGELNCLGDVS